jgi:site-specific DNA recombinase
MNGETFVTYRRVSTKEQAEEGFSLDAQAKLLVTFGQGRGWTQGADYCDDGYSGKDTNRPAFKRLLRDARTGKFKYVVVHKLDRFSRNVVDTLTLFKELEAMGVVVVSATEMFDFSTPIGRVLLTLLVAFAQWFLDNLSEETKKGKRERWEQGKYNGSSVPFGYTVAFQKDLGDGIPRPNEHHTVIEQAFFLSRGGLSDSKVATELNRRQAAAPEGLGRWTKDTLTQILTNRFYIGEVQYKGEWREGEHKEYALIDPRLFEEVQQIRKTRAYNRTGSKQERDYPLAGVLYCGKCGERFRAGLERGNRHYRDMGRDRQTGCKQRRITAKRAEDEIGRILSELRLPDDWQAAVMEFAKRQAKNHATLDAMRARREQLEKIFNALKLQHRYGDISDLEYERERKIIFRELEELELPPNTPVNMVDNAKLLLNCGELWKVATDAERKRLVKAIFSKIVMYTDDEKILHIEVYPRPDMAMLFELAKTAN